MQPDTKKILTDFEQAMARIENMHLPDVAGNVQEIRRMVANLDEKGLKAKIEQLKQKDNAERGNNIEP